MNARSSSVMGALALFVLPVACDDTGSDPPGEPLQRLYATVGGLEALTAFETIRYDASGAQSVHSEARQPGMLLEVNTFDKQVAYEETGRRSRTDENRDTRFPFEFPRVFTRVLRGDTGWTDGTEGVPVFLPSGDIQPDKAAGHARMQALLVPHILLARVARGELSAQYDGIVQYDGSVHHKYTLGEGLTAIEAMVSESTGRLDALRTTVHDTLLCDQQLEVRLEGWTNVGDYDFPAHVELRGFGGVIHVEDRSSTVFNAVLPESTFSVPPEALLPADADLAETGKLRFPYYHFTSAMGVPFPLNQHEIDSVALAPGVTLLLASHNSLVVEQADRIVLVEAPLDGDRSEAILGWIAETYPGKEVSHVISTHHHLDHAGGLRRLVAEGSVVVAAEQGAGFLATDVFGASCTVLPDALSESPIPAVLESVPANGAFVLDDPVVPVVAYQIDTAHAADMLIVHLPNQGLVFNSDLYNPLPPELAGMVTPYFREIELLDLVAGLALHDIEPAVIVGGHGGVALAEEFEADVSAVGG